MVIYNQGRMSLCQIHAWKAGAKLSKFTCVTVSTLGQCEGNLVLASTPNQDRNRVGVTLGRLHCFRRSHLLGRPKTLQSNPCSGGGGLLCCTKVFFGVHIEIVDRIITEKLTVEEPYLPVSAGSSPTCLMIAAES